MKKIFTFVLFTFLFLSGLSIKTAATEAYNINTNPGPDLATTIHINYHSDITGTFVDYTKADDPTYANKVTVFGTERLFSKPENESGYLSNGFAERYVVTVELTDLEPNTKYIYRVGKTVFSKNYSFQTATTSDTFTFLHITDPQFSSSATILNNLLNTAYTKNPDIAFTFLTGDVVDRGGIESQWTTLYLTNNISKGIIAVGPGNHEYYDASPSPQHYNNSYFNAFYNNPKNGAETILNSSYYFRYNDELFIMLDTETKEFTAQKNWFEKIMNENIDARYTVVGMHRSFYGSIYASDSITVRSHWQALFDRYGVDLVLSGHDHVYARSKHIYSNAISTDLIKGTTYIIGGSGGAKFYAAVPNDKYAKVIELTSVANLITISPTAISTELIDQSGNTLDTATIARKRVGTVLDTFDKSAFLETMNVIVDPNDSVGGIVQWDTNAYGNVGSVRVLNKQYQYVISQTFMYHPSFTELKFSGIYPDRVNSFTIEVNFADQTKSLFDVEFDTRPPVVNKTILEVLDMIYTQFHTAFEKILEPNQ